MDADRKKRLTELGPEALADALLELAVRVDVADDLVERLISNPKENTRRCKAKLADLKRRQRFISWDESAAFAHELIMVLEDLKSGVDDSRTGVKLAAAFYRTDRAVFEQWMTPVGLWAMFSALTPKNSLSPMRQDARTSNG
jgi:hypothetical protein